MAKLSQLSQIVLLLNERSSCLLVAARLLSTCQSIVRFKAWLVSPSLPFVATIDSFGLETVPLRPPKPTLLAKWKKAKYKKRVTDWAAALVLKFCQKGGKVHHFFSLLILEDQEVVKVWWWHKLVNQAVQFPKANFEEKNYHHLLQWTSSTSTSSWAWKSLIYLNNIANIISAFQTSLSNSQFQSKHNQKLERWLVVLELTRESNQNKWFCIFFKSAPKFLKNRLRSDKR